MSAQVNVLKKLAHPGHFRQSVINICPQPGEGLNDRMLTGILAAVCKARHHVTNGLAEEACERREIQVS